ncbi:MAG: membrane protein insertase YidC [Chloroflexi bacterium]|nr:membrane protein insertase YidC [Chloroflexota bacterium]
MWDLILNPFVTLMTLLYSWLGQNMVLAIIAFTLLIRLATYPLTAQQQRSMRAQQELAPKLRKLQEKYKNDREKLAQEQMAMYREAGINPLGGCLPLLIQFPILIALYQAIIYALANTPTQLLGLSGRLLIPGLDHLIPLNNMWLGMDLTLPPTTNPIWAMALPLLVLVTTWLQYKMMPQPAPNPDSKPDQAQAMTQSMGTIMPLMFGWFSLSFSVGLSIYFVVSNIIGIIQYRLTPKPAPATLSAADESENGKGKRVESKSEPKAKPTGKVK